MKKVLLLVLSALLPVLAGGQAQIQTRRYKVSDFNSKVMKVVLGADPMLDASLKAAMQDIWHISPYEFSDMGEFESLKKKPDFYFLMVTKSSDGDGSDSSIRTLTIYKGSAGATDKLSSLLEVVSLPVGSARSDGRDIVLLPALLSVLQEQTQVAISKEILLGDGVRVTGSGLFKKWDKKVYLCISDLGFEPDDACRQAYEDDGVVFCDEDTIMELTSSRAEGVLVSYCVAPERPVKGSKCYKMLLDPATHELYYYDVKTINPSKEYRFCAQDLKHITSKTKQ